MKFKVANYELKINANQQIENICVYLTSLSYSYYLDILSTDNIPLEKVDKNNICKLRQILKKVRRVKSIYVM